MIFHPPILALIVASMLTSAFLVWASVFAVRLLRQWDLASGAETQLSLERRTYLVSTVVAFALVSELASLVLFVFNADRMSVMFTGAMCAVGTLNASIYGFPALMAKIGVFFAAALWLTVHHADGKGRDYPFTRLKYKLILGLAPVVVLAAGLQLAYFLDLKPDTITSCCGKMFAPDRPSIAGEMAGLGEGAAFLLFAGLGMTLALGAFAAWGVWQRVAVLAYGTASAAFYIVALAAIISVVSLYVYEHPHHHCPFCILKREYSYFGFALYAPLFAGTAFGVAASFLGGACGRPSLEGVLPGMLRRLVLMSMACFAMFGALAAWAMVTSKLVLFNA